MTTEDERGDSPEDEGPITPEVVRRGASNRKRRVGPIDGPAPDDSPAPRPGRPARQPNGRTFRRGCTVLAGLGILVLINGVSLAVSPASVRCSTARAAVETAHDDDETFNDVPLPEGTSTDEISDLDCDVAISLAGQIPEDEDSQPDGKWVTEGAIRNFGMLYAVIGMVLGVLGFFLLKKQTRTLRSVALGVTILSMLLVAPAMTLAGLPIGLVMVIYVIYAIGLSADAKALFPIDRSRPSMFRPRPPAADS